MKFLSAIATLTVLVFANFAQAALVKKACYQDEDKEYGAFVVEVSIFTDQVIVRNKSEIHGDLGSYRGRIISSNNLVRKNNKVSVKNLTLNDGADGYLDNVSIEITRNTVKFDSKNSVSPAKPRISCL